MGQSVFNSSASPHRRDRQKGKDVWPTVEMRGVAVPAVPQCLGAPRESGRRGRGRGSAAPGPTLGLSSAPCGLKLQDLTTWSLHVGRADFLLLTPSRWPSEKLPASTVQKTTVAMLGTGCVLITRRSDSSHASPGSLLPSFLFRPPPAVPQSYLTAPRLRACREECSVPPHTPVRAPKEAGSPPGLGETGRWVFIWTANSHPGFYKIFQAFLSWP